MVCTGCAVLKYIFSSISRVLYFHPKILLVHQHCFTFLEFLDGSMSVMLVCTVPRGAFTSQSLCLGCGLLFYKIIKSFRKHMYYTTTFYKKIDFNSELRLNCHIITQSVCRR